MPVPAVGVYWFWVDRLLGERLRLDGLNAAFDRLAAGESIRQIVELD